PESAGQSEQSAWDQRREQPARRRRSRRAHLVTVVPLPSEYHRRFSAPDLWVPTPSKPRRAVVARMAARDDPISVADRTRGAKRLDLTPLLQKLQRLCLAASGRGRREQGAACEERVGRPVAIHSARQSAPVLHRSSCLASRSIA